jgi:hypothetical protein
MAIHSLSESSLPEVVDAVVTTLIIIAGGKTPVRFTLVKSWTLLSHLQAIKE